MHPLVIIFILTTLSFLVAFMLSPVLSFFLYKYRFSKNIRTSNEAPVYSALHSKKAGTPTMGGILIWGTTLLLALLFFIIAQFYPDAFTSSLNFLTRPETYLPLGSLIASAIVGLVDDFFNARKKGTESGGLRVRHRLLIYAGIALIGAWWFVSKLDWTTIHVPFVGNFDIGIWYLPIFFIIIIATSFSVNETDGLDGLAGGTLIASFGVFSSISFMQGKFALAAFCGVIIGALLAFLWFNVTPARFFMGDTGAMSLGVTLGIVAMLTNSALLLPIICFILVLESLSVLLQIFSRRVLKKKMFLSSPLHHHLEAAGWSEPKIVMRFWIISGISAMVGLIIAIVDYYHFYG